MIDRVYILSYQSEDVYEIHGVYMIRENAQAEADRLNAKWHFHYFQVEEHPVTTFIYCGKGPCWSPEGHEGECMPDE